MNQSGNPILASEIGDTDELEKMEIEFLLEAIFRRYGFDFRNYVYSSIQRRIWYQIQAENLTSVSTRFYAKMLFLLRIIWQSITRLMNFT